MPLGKDIPLERGQRNTPLIGNRYFTTIGSSSVETVTDRHRLAAWHITTSTADELSGGTNIDDLERI